MIAHEIKDRKAKEARKALLTVYPSTECNVFAVPPPHLQTHTQDRHSLILITCEGYILCQKGVRKCVLVKDLEVGDDPGLCDRCDVIRRVWGCQWSWRQRSCCSESGWTVPRCHLGGNGPRGKAYVQSPELEKCKETYSSWNTKVNSAVNPL